jgi:hypothetical protein
MNHPRKNQHASDEETNLPQSKVENLAVSSAENQWIPHVLSKVRALQYGTVHVKVHDSQVVSVETVEHTRFELAPMRPKAKR